MKKKVVSIVLASALTLSMLAGCGSGSETQETQTEETAETEESAAPEEAEESDEEEIADEATATETGKATLDRTVIYDEGGITVTVKGLEHIDSEARWKIPITVSNTADQEFEVGSDRISVNGFMIRDSYFYAMPEVGGSEDTRIEIKDSDLAKQGIDTIAKIEFPLEIRVDDDDNGILEIIAASNVTLTTSAGADYVQSAVDGEVIYEDDNIRVLSLGWMDDENWGGEYVLCAENNTDMMRVVEVWVTAINGNGKSDGGSRGGGGFIMAAGSSELASLVLHDLSDFGVASEDEIQTMEVYFIIQAWNADGTSSGTITTDPITLNLE